MMSVVDPWILNYFRSIKGQGVKILSCASFHYSLLLYENFFVFLNNFIDFYVHPLFLILQYRTTIQNDYGPRRYKETPAFTIYYFIC
jgi:hypothetical protein